MTTDTNGTAPAQADGAARPILVLAFSGGLDTSYCARRFSRERDAELHTVVVDTGGFTDTELARIEERAYALGATRHVAIDAQREFYDRCVRYLIYGNVLRNHTYPLSVSAERLFQAVRIAEYARSVGARFVAHGSTGAGNDQVRFDMVFRVLSPDAEILTPIRDEKLSRRETTTYLQEQGVEIAWEKSRYSINKGLWGTSVGGAETLTSHLTLPEEAWPTPVTATAPRAIMLRFEKGELRGVDGETLDPVDAIKRVEEIAAPFGVGRDVHVGDTIVGIKGRVGFQASGPMVIIRAHQLLEKHTLTKWQLHWKDQLGGWYGGFTHEALFQEPVMRDIETFLESTQARVTGEVEVMLHPHRFELIGIRSPYDMLQSGFGTYGEENGAWSGDDVRGYTAVLSVPILLHASVGEEADARVGEGT